MIRNNLETIFLISLQKETVVAVEVDDLPIRAPLQPTNNFAPQSNDEYQTTDVAPVHQTSELSHPPIQSLNSMEDSQMIDPNNRLQGSENFKYVDISRQPDVQFPTGGRYGYATPEYRPPNRAVPDQYRNQRLNDYDQRISRSPQRRPKGGPRTQSHSPVRRSDSKQRYRDHVSTRKSQPRRVNPDQQTTDRATKHSSTSRYYDRRQSDFDNLHSNNKSRSHKSQKQQSTTAPPQSYDPRANAPKKIPRIAMPSTPHRSTTSRPTQKPSKLVYDRSRSSGADLRTSERYADLY